MTISTYSPAAYRSGYFKHRRRNRLNGIYTQIAHRNKIKLLGTRLEELQTENERLRAETQRINNELHTVRRMQARLNELRID